MNVKFKSNNFDMKLGRRFHVLGIKLDVASSSNEWRFGKKIFIIFIKPCIVELGEGNGTRCSNLARI